jgi:hypothetical protein
MAKDGLFFIGSSRQNETVVSGLGLSNGAKECATLNESAVMNC